MTTIAEIQAAVAAGADPARFLAEARARIAARDAELKAFLHVDEAAVVGEGPLAGVAVGVKDIVETAEMPTMMGSPIYAGNRPAADAAIVAMLKNAGTTIIGKTATTPFAFLDPAATLNPHDASATPGGSSSGSAAAVAAGLVPLALGTQTGGSVIRPAAFCGVPAIKPSYGLLPTVGVKCFSWSLDTLGFFARSVEDLRIAMRATTGRQEFDAPPPGSTFDMLVCRQDFAGAADPAAEEALGQAVEAMRRQGHRVIAKPFPEEFVAANAIHATLQNYEAFRALGHEWRCHRAALPPKLAALLELAATITPEAFDDVRKTAKVARDMARKWFQTVDIVLTYAAPGEAPPRETTGDPRYNRLWTLLGTPCVHVPVLKGPKGLPVGVQLVARFGRDAKALDAAAQLEAALARGG